MCHLPTVPTQLAGGTLPWFSEPWQMCCIDCDRSGIQLPHWHGCGRGRIYCADLAVNPPWKSLAPAPLQKMFSHWRWQMLNFRIDVVDLVLLQEKEVHLNIAFTLLWQSNTSIASYTSIYIQYLWPGTRKLFSVAGLFLHSGTRNSHASNQVHSNIPHITASLSLLFSFKWVQIYS